MPNRLFMCSLLQTQPMKSCFVANDTGPPLSTRPNELGRTHNVPEKRLSDSLARGRSSQKYKTCCDNMRVSLFGLSVLFVAAWAVPAKVVSLSPNGKLQYSANAAGDRIMDFSSAGFEGGKNLPSTNEIPVRTTVKPSGGDDTTNIQKAIDTVSALPLSGKYRGAVLLAPGNFQVTSWLPMF